MGLRDACLLRGSCGPQALGCVTRWWRGACGLGDGRLRPPYGLPPLLFAPSQPPHSFSAMADFVQALDPSKLVLVGTVRLAHGPTRRRAAQAAY